MLAIGGGRPAAIALATSLVTRSRRRCARVLPLDEPTLYGAMASRKGMIGFAGTVEGDEEAAHSIELSRSV